MPGKSLLRLFFLQALGLAVAESQWPCVPHMSVSLVNGTAVEGGSVLLDGLRFPPASQFQLKGELRGCPCLLRNCIRRCCEPGKILRINGCLEPRTLNNSTYEFDVPYLSDKIFHPEIRDYERHFYILYNDTCLTGKFLSYDAKNYSHFISPNGTLEITNRKTHGVTKSVPNERYCVTYAEKLRTETFAVCPLEEEIRQKNINVIVLWIYAFCSFMSAVCLMMTFAVYLMFSSLRNLHGKILMVYIACLFVAYIFSSLINQEVLVQKFSKGFCTASAFIVLFSFLASFFWLNVMCFDIWWTFGGFRSLHGSVKQRKKFIIYSLYAWGCASLITIICMIMDFVPSIPETFIRPGFGKRKCWFDSNTARAIYFYVPMGVTIFCNICLFILTAIKILRHHKDTARQLKGNDSRCHEDNKQWFNLYLRLFVVMGVSWSMEIISWIFEKDGMPKYIWYIPDLFNTLQGVIIFLIFVWKDKIKRLLMKKFGWEGGCFLFRKSTPSDCPTSSTSRTTSVTSTPLQEITNMADPKFHSKTSVNNETNCK